MNRNDVQYLQSLRGSPAVSILMPTHRTHPDNGQDPIRLKNLVKQAAERLLETYPRREVDAVLHRLNQLAEDYNPREAASGLALFVSPDFSAQYTLPFPIRERVIIGQDFATRDLVRALNRAVRYWALVLGEQPTRLYEGVRDTLTEMVGGEFPMSHLGPGGAEPLPGGFGVKRSAIRDENDRKFFRRVDEAFGRLAAAEGLPTVLVGVERNLAFFKEVSKHMRLVVATLKGSHDSTPPSELAQLVWPLMREHLQAQRAEALEQLEAAVGARQFTSGLTEVWREARAGRVATLLVEEGYHTPARLDAAGATLIPLEDTPALDGLNDAVDDLIEMVMDKGGRVIFVDDGRLAKHQRVAAILRY